MKKYTLEFYYNNGITEKHKSNSKSYIKRTIKDYFEDDSGAQYIDRRFHCYRIFDNEKSKSLNEYELLEF